MKKFLLFLLTIAAFLIKPAASWQKEQFYIDNSVFSGDYRLFRSELFAELRDLMAATGKSWRLDGTKLIIDDTAKRVSMGPNIGSESLIIFADGMLVDLEQEVFAGKIFVPVAQYADIFGDNYSWNSDLALGDYKRAANGSSFSRLNSKSSPRRFIAGSPLRLKELEFDIKPGIWDEPSLYGYAIIENVGSKISNVVIKAEIYDEYGVLQGKFSRELAAMEPGDAICWQFPLWTDFNGSSGLYPVISYKYTASSYY
ncbi:MAG: hypothetical protein K6G50_12535 [bacterium]|nr:hypothetical protein [bacterium]